MKIIIVSILIIILIVFMIQIFIISKERNQLREEFGNLAEKADNFAKENEKIKSEMEYYSNSENLEKEFRAKFNYKKIGEKMIIIAP